MTQKGTEIGRVEHAWTHERGERSICGVRLATKIALGQRILITGQRMRLGIVHGIQLHHVALADAGPSDERHGVDVGVSVHEGERLYAIESADVELIEGLADRA